MLAFHRGKLDDDKIALLEKLGIAVRRPDPWAPPTRISWHSRTSTVTCGSPRGTRAPAASTSATGRLTSASGAKPGARPKDQERLLDEIGFDWDPGEEAWQARYAEAAAWKDEHGSLRFPRGHPVGGWLYRQLKLQGNGRLQEDRARLLRDLGAIASTEKHDAANTEPQARDRP